MTRSKRCPVSHQDKLAEDFYIDRSHASGLRSPCKECDLKKARRYYAQNRERKLAKAKARSDAKRAAKAPKPPRQCVQCGADFQPHSIRSADGLSTARALEREAQ
jgi:hypothetical protein